MDHPFVGYLKHQMLMCCNAGTVILTFDQNLLKGNKLASELENSVWNYNTSDHCYARHQHQGVHNAHAMHVSTSRAKPLTVKVYITQYNRIVGWHLAEFASVFLIGDPRLDSPALIRDLEDERAINI